MITGTLRALALSANKEPGRNLYIWFYYNVSFFRNSKFQVIWCFTGQRKSFLKKCPKLTIFKENDSKHFQTNDSTGLQMG